MTITLGAYLTIDGAAAAIDYYKAAFGAEELRRMPSEDGGKVIHAEIRVFGQVVMLADAFPEYGDVKSPAALGGTTFNLIVGLEKPGDVDAALEKAAKAGGVITMPADDMFWGDRFGMLRDPFGHMWGFGAPLG